MSDFQGTVAAFDPDSLGGEVFSDSGERVAFGREAFDVSGLRVLRPGQRVQVTRAADGSVIAIGIPTIVTPHDVEPQ